MTALHRFACERVKEAAELWLPAKIARFGSLWRQVGHEQAVRPDRAELEATRGDVRADVILVVNGHELAVEVWVHHRSDREKRRKYAALGLAAIEINLTSTPVDADPAEVEADVLKRAAREWLYHPHIARAERELVEENERRRKREADELARREARSRVAAEAYLAKVRGWQPVDGEAPAALMEAAERMRAAGRGQDTTGDPPLWPWFRIGPRMLEMFILDRHALRLDHSGPPAAPFTIKEVLLAVVAVGVVNPAWAARPRGDVANWLEMNMPADVGWPEDAIEDCLHWLAEGGMFAQRWDGSWQPTVDAQLWAREQRQAAAERRGAEAAIGNRDQRLEERLASLQAALEGEGITFDPAAWRRTALPGRKASPDDLVLDPGLGTGSGFSDMLAQLDRVLALVEPDTAPTDELLGLPVDQLQAAAVARVAARRRKLLAEVEDAMRPWLTESDPPGFDLTRWATATKLGPETTVADFVAVTSGADRQAAKRGKVADETLFEGLIVDVLATLRRLTDRTWPIGDLHGLPLTGLVERRAAEHEAAQAESRVEDLARRARRILPDPFAALWLERPNPALWNLAPHYAAGKTMEYLAAAIAALDQQAPLLRKFPAHCAQPQLLLGWAYTRRKELDGRSPLEVHGQPPHAAKVAQQLRDIVARVDTIAR